MDESFLEKTSSVEESSMNPLVLAWGAAAPMPMAMQAVAGEAQDQQLGRVSSSGAPPLEASSSAATAASDPLSRLSAVVGKSLVEVEAMGEEDLLLLMAASNIGTVLKNEVLVALSAAKDGREARAVADPPPANEDVERWRRELADNWPDHEGRQAWQSGLHYKIHLGLVLMGALCFWVLMYSTVEDSVDCWNDGSSCGDGDDHGASKVIVDVAEWRQYASRHDVLQLHGPFASSMTPEKTFRNLAMHSTLSLNFRYFGVGTWDAERAMVWVDGELVWRSDELSGGSCSSGWAAGSDVLMGSKISEDAEGRRRRRLRKGGGHTPAPPPALNYGQVCYTDISLVVPHHSDSITLRFGSTLDEHVDNEAFFFGDITANICAQLGPRPSPAPHSGPPPPPPRCHFEVGDGTGGFDQYIGEAETQQACVNMAVRSSDDANGATFQAYDSFTTSGSCWAEFHMTGSDGNQKFRSCMFRNSSTILPALESCKPTHGPISTIQSQQIVNEAQDFTTDGWTLRTSATFSLDWVRSLDAALPTTGNATDSADEYQCWNICTSIGDDCCAPGDEVATCDAGLTAVHIASDECDGGKYKCCGPSAAAPALAEAQYPLGTSTRLTWSGGWWIYLICGWLFFFGSEFYRIRTGARYGLRGCAHHRGTAQLFRITGGFDGSLQTTATRLVLRGKSAPCACWPGRCGGLGLRAEYKQAAPRELLARGITEEVWREWMVKLDGTERSARWFDLCRVSTTSYQPWFWCCLDCNTLGAVPFMWHWIWWFTCCCIPWSRVDPYQMALKKYLHEFNEVLEPHGIFVKAFCFKQTGEEGDQHNDNSLATLVFSLTQEERQVLEMEPVLQQGRSEDPNWACWCLPCHSGRAV